jgi:predicted dehydrogenase
MKLKGVGIGAGYFAGFQYRAWNRIPEVQVTALCNRDKDKALPIMKECEIGRHYTDYREMLDTEKPDFVDIITPPSTHLEMCKEAADRGINIICQKPLAPSLGEAKELVAYCLQKGVRFMIHENWRFQPWYRELKKLIDDDTIGAVHYMYFRSRMGDGWGENAYIPRQPYFREYPRLLIFENGIHFIDTFRYLKGEISSVYANLRRLNPVIKGEDFGLVSFTFESGDLAMWDANRYNQPNFENPRYTFGEMLLDGTGGSMRLYNDGTITIQPLGKKEEKHFYLHHKIDFSGDCVYTTQRHFINCLISGDEFETNGPDYLKSLAIQEAVYDSAKTNTIIHTKKYYTL